MPFKRVFKVISKIISIFLPFFQYLKILGLDWGFINVVCIDTYIESFSLLLAKSDFWKKGFYLMNLHARRPRIRANMGVSFLEQKIKRN